MFSIEGKSLRLDKAQYREVRNMKSDSANVDIFREDRLLVTVDLLEYIAIAVVLEKTAMERDQKRKGEKRSKSRLAVIQW